jgi:hypothetical protein
LKGLPVLSLLTPSIEDVIVNENAVFSQKVTYIRVRFGQNQGLWSQKGDTMSPGLGGFFRLIKRGTSDIVPDLKLLLFHSPKRSHL